MFASMRTKIARGLDRSINVRANQSSRGLEDARRRDEFDPLREFRARFEIPEGVVYLDGNSLGALSGDARRSLERVIQVEWGQGLIRSWNDHDWINAPERVGTKVARLIGAEADEVIVCDSTSVNLYKLVRAALDLRRDRCVVVSEPGNFPTDLYVLDGALRDDPRYELRLAPAASLGAAIDERTALVMLTHVHYKTAAMHDLRAITARAHACGALVLWDLSHSAGAVEIDLDDCAADMAVGCGYKYLNGGPGAPAFLYVNRRLQHDARSPLSGWMGHARPFDFTDAYQPAPGLRRFLSGTPSALSLAPLEAGVEMLLEAGVPALTRKSRELSQHFIELVGAMCPAAGLRLESPADARSRGSHVSFSHPEGYAIMQALIGRHVIGDFRPPDILRFGFTPLYTSFEDVWRAAQTLADVIGGDCWRDPKYTVRGAVT
jgi:kynureninase